MKIKFKEDALKNNSKKTPAHVGYSQSQIDWRKSVREIIESSEDGIVDVETDYLHDNSFNVRHPDGYSVSIPEYMVEKVFNDKRNLNKRTEEKFEYALKSAKFMIKLHKKPVWIVATEDNYRTTLIEPKQKDIIKGTAAVLYDLENDELLEKKKIKSKNQLKNKR